MVDQQRKKILVMDHLSASNPVLHRALCTLQTNRLVRQGRAAAFVQKTELAVECKRDEAMLAMAGLNKEPLDKILPKPVIADCVVLAKVDTCRAKQFEKEAAEGGEC